MAPFGYLLLLGGAFLIRQVTVGRAKDIPGDAKDAATALLSADWVTFGEVLGRRGENVSADATVTSSGSAASADTFGLSGALSAISGSGFVNECVRLGKSATGYRLGGVGPTYYDCSGLIWRAATNLKLFLGPRFTTHNFTSIASGWCKQVSTPTVGDIILWSNHHMGIYIGEDRMYSARSPSKGIGESTISGDSSYFGSAPTYWRITGGS